MQFVMPGAESTCSADLPFFIIVAMAAGCLLNPLRAASVVLKIDK